MGIRYDALLNGIKEAEQYNHIIVDRGSDKVQEVSLKRFLFFSNALKAANIKLSTVKTDVLSKADPEYKAKKKDAKSRLEGEKKLAQLRKVNEIYDEWQKTILGKKRSKNIEDLKKEQKKLSAVIEKMTQFKEDVEKKINDKHLFGDLTLKDEAEIQKLNDSLNALQARQEVITSIIASKNGTLSPKQASVILSLDRIESIVKERAIYRLQDELSKDFNNLINLEQYIKNVFDKENLNEIDELVEKIKKYEELHQTTQERLLQIKKHISAMPEMEKTKINLKNAEDFLKEKADFNKDVLFFVRKKIEDYNKEALKLSPSKVTHNSDALDTHKTLIFFKKCEKALLTEEIKKMEEERKKAHKKIEDDHPKISVPFPKLEGVDERLHADHIKKHKSTTEAYDKLRDEELSPLKQEADQAIDREFDYTFIESKILDLGDFSYVRAYDYYQMGKPLDAGREIWKHLLSVNEKLPSKEEFDLEAKEIFGERLDPQIYAVLVKDFHETRAAAKGDIVWFEWVNEKKAIPSWDEFRLAFQKKVGIEPIKENYERLVNNLNAAKKRNAENVWVHLSGKNKTIPSWDEFKKFFKESIGIEPDSALYLDILQKEIDLKSERLTDILGVLKGLVPYLKPQETWYAKGDKAIKSKLRSIEDEIKEITQKLIDAVDKASPEEQRRLKTQLEEAIISRESVISFLKNRDRVLLREEAEALNDQIKELKSKLEEAHQ